LNGIDRSKKEVVQVGEIPLQTFKIAIQYTQRDIFTIYGVYGLKV
jgi:ribosomal protein S3